MGRHSTARSWGLLLIVACSAAGCRGVPETGCGYEDLHLAIVAALEEQWDVGDRALTTAYYQSINDGWQMQDLNGDGQAEAICRASMAVFEPGKPQYIGGATGNAPLFIFQRVDGFWRLIADASSMHHEVTDHTVNGWSVLLTTWRVGGPERGTSVMVYDGNRYKTVHHYVQGQVNP